MGDSLLLNMNILIISFELPYPLDSGGSQAQFNLIDELRKKHAISFLFAENGMNARSAMRTLQAKWPEVKFYCYPYWRQLCHPRFFAKKVRRALQLTFQKNRASFQKQRILEEYGACLSKDFYRMMQRILRNDRIEVVQTEFYQYLPIVRHLPKQVKSVFIHHEIHFVRNRRLLASFSLTESERALLEKQQEKEIALLNCYDAVVALTETDRLLLLENGVRTSVFTSPATVGSPVRTYAGWNGRLTFLGGYKHVPNSEGVKWLLEEVFPLMSDEAIRLDIIGPHWPDFSESQSSSRVAVTRLGFVEQLEDALGGSIMLVPILSGSGMRMKILEAAALGVPFITTTVGVEGLQFRHEEACLVADTPQDFAKALSRLMREEDLRRRLTQKAAEVYHTYYSKTALSQKREEVYSFLNNKIFQ